MAQVSKANRKANPALTRNGKVRIKGLSLDKLQKLSDNTTRPRDKDKIQRRMNTLNKRSA
jgi:hypothetical protein